MVVRLEHGRLAKVAPVRVCRLAAARDRAPAVLALMDMVGQVQQVAGAVVSHWRALQKYGPVAGTYSRLVGLLFRLRGPDLWSARRSSTNQTW